MLRLHIKPDQIETKLKGLHIENNRLKEEVDRYYLNKKDEEAHEMNCYFLQGINEYLPYFIVNMMANGVKQLRSKSRFRVFRYGEIRFCENILTETEWFEELETWKQNYILEDFDRGIINPIINAHLRKKQWRAEMKKE